MLLYSIRVKLLGCWYMCIFSRQLLHIHDYGISSTSTCNMHIDSDMYRAAACDIMSIVSIAKIAWHAVPIA